MESNIIMYAEVALDYGVMGLLILMSVVTLWLFMERMMFYKSVRIDDYDNRDKLEIDLTDNISVISVIGSNAPYVGLLGTVIGIMLAFYTMGDVGSVDAKKIMVGLALALKATAMGLMPLLLYKNAGNSLALKAPYVSPSNDQYSPVPRTRPSRAMASISDRGVVEKLIVLLVLSRVFI